MIERLKQTTLIIAGHGSSKSPNQARPARKHAAHIAKKGLFADVKTAFWKEDTRLKDVLEGVLTPEVVIVPNLACSGHINKVVIPREMGLKGELTQTNTQRIHLCKPVGEHEGLPALIAKRLKEVMQERDLAPKDTTVFLVAHGNPNPDRPASHDTTVMMATRIYQHYPLHAILPAFLEEKPFLKGWSKRTTTKNIIVLPFMIAAGTHGARDVPRFIGVEPTEKQSMEMRENAIPAGPFEVEGHHLWIMRAMGSHPTIADFIVDIAEERLSEVPY
ncbi:putative Cobalamin (Vitamin B12) biosynthesis CbiX protein [Candidatus Terasakiella magnetica]|uniref:Putative Cobalamin (Vitamin B12) biosynthesis CbiX protein n=1 Tax=Candidatus Terasakiella magnetica TaxID=1867952 RepID=A0A1C3RK72_9PROT|nr:CbiX/SirB N-terminal domain-containing protein [Candidatus Terasakiella magnetica]SCA57647.1 putative Cobalamin (Vitamin B12) biosynthesis CbiX protein [Candidatus Terasakiella magnetica]